MTKKAQEFAAEVEEIKSSDFDGVDDVDFDQEFQEADGTVSIAFAQLCTTDVGLTRFAAMPSKDFPYGLFIPASQAEKCGFTPNDNWVTEYPCLGGKVRKFGPGEGTEGYFLKPGSEARIVLVAQSQQEVYKNTEFNGKPAKACIGNYLVGFDADGKPIKSDAGMAFDAAPPNSGWQNSIRYLIYFLNDDNTPMSDTPLTLRISNAFGIGFKSEMKLNLAEAMAATKAHSELNKSRAIAKAEAVKAAAIASGDVQGGIDAEAALKIEKRKTIRSLGRKDAYKCVFAFSQAMRENSSGVGTTYVSGRAQPSIWSDAKPAPFNAERTKKNGEVIYAITITPTDYRKLFIRAQSDFGIQLEEDLVTYKDYKIAPNLRKLAKELAVAPAIAMPDFDPTADDDDVSVHYDYEEPGDYGATAIESDPAFSQILTTLIKAVSPDQVGKWKVWAMKPTQRNAFIEAYPSYDDDLENLAVRHSATFK